MGMTPRQKQGIMAMATDADGNYYYNDKLDGKWGPKSQAAADRFLKDFTGEKTEAETEEKTTSDLWDGIRYWTPAEFKCRCGEYHDPYCDGFPVQPDRKLLELVDDIRHKAGAPGYRSSGIRCHKHNIDSGGVPSSRHKLGKALDFCIEGLSGQKLLAIAQADPRTRYAYQIKDGSGNLTNYVHVDVE